MDWLLKFSASEGTRFFWEEARKLFRDKPVDSLQAAERVFGRIDPWVRLTMAEEGSAPAFLEHARLAIEFWDRVLAHRVTPAAAERVRRVQLGNFPDQAPRLLLRPWLLEVQRPLAGERLYGDTTALGCYPTSEAGVWMLLGWMYVQGEPRLRGMFWMQNWTRGNRQMPDLHEEGYEWHDGAWVEATQMPAAAFHERQHWFREGVRFATVLGALLEADNTFLRTHDTVSRVEKGQHSGRAASRSPRWIVRHVTLDGNEVEPKPTTKGNETPLVTDGLTLTEVPIREYVRLQPHGPGNRERKWVRIKEHMSKRWTSSTPKRIIVDSK